MKGRDEIREVFEKGRRIGCQGAKLFVLRNQLPCNRICFTLSRGYGNAVERNRARRIGREAYRHLKPRLRCGAGGPAAAKAAYDLILLVYSEKTRLTFAGRMEQLQYLFTRAGLL